MPTFSSLHIENKINFKLTQMKKLIFILLSITSFVCLSQAQITVSATIGHAPQWGPAGYDNAQYYYLPDIELYYDIYTNSFIYYSGTKWVRRNYLPSRYRNYDLYNGYKVVLTNYRGNMPYKHFKEHKIKYHKGYKDKKQRNIGSRPDNRKTYSKSNTVIKAQNKDKHDNLNKTHKNNKSNKKTIK